MFRFYSSVLVVILYLAYGVNAKFPPNDYFIFSNIKKWLSGNVFVYNYQIIDETNAYLKDLEKSYSLEGIQKLEKRWAKSEDPKPCKYGDSTCLTKAIDYFLHEKNQGDGSINLVKLDPLEVNKIVMKQGADSPVNIDLVFTKNSIYGLKSAKVVKVSGFGKDLTQKHEIVLKANQVDLVGDYTVDGKILILPIKGSGTSNITMINPVYTLTFTGTPMEKDGATYMKINKFQLVGEPERIIFKIDNLFNGDKVLGDNMNLFLNENWADIYKEMRDTIASAFGKIFQSVIGHVFTKYPYDKFFVE